MPLNVNATEESWVAILLNAAEQHIYHWSSQLRHSVMLCLESLHSLLSKGLKDK